MAINLGQINFGLGAVTTGLRAATQAVNNFASSFVRAAQQQQRAAQQAQAATNNMAGSIRQLSQFAILVNGPMSGLATRLNIISGVARDVNLSTAAMVTGLSLGVAGFMALARTTVNTEKNLQRITQTLDATNNNLVITKIQMADLMTIADRAGGEFQTVAQGYARMQAASAGTNMEGEATRKIFQEMLLVSQKLGLSVADTEGIFRALEQIMSKGTVQAEELRGQLGDRLPGAFQIMADALGVTTKKLGEMMKKGQVSGDALVKFSETAAKRFGVDITKPIDNLVSSEGRLWNAVTRTTDAFDKAVGISAAYQATLRGLTAVVDFIGQNITTLIASIGALAGGTLGLLAAIYAPAVIAGFTALVTAFRSLAVATIAWNAALLANPIAAIATLLVRVGLAAAGAVAGFELMEGAINSTAGAHLGAIPEVKAYISAQEDMKYSIRDTTNEYIKQQQVLLQGMYSAIRKTREAVEQTKFVAYGEGAVMADPVTGMPVPDPYAREKANTELPGLEKSLKDQINSARDAMTDMNKLYTILNKQTEIEKKRSNSLNDMTDSQKKNTDAVRNAIDAALDSIRETQEALNIQNAPKYAQEWMRVQAGITKSVDDFRDKLVQAKVPLETINALTGKYAELTRSLKEGEYYIKTHVSAWEALSGVLGRGMDNAMSTMVDGMLEGRDAMETLREAAKYVVSDMIKTFLQLSAINPLKNALFGGDPSTGMPFQTLGGGGLLGTLFSAFTNGGGASADPWAGLRIAGNARGTSGWRGGLTWVGEDGPELVSLGAGSKVHTSKQSRSMVSGGGDNQPVKLLIGVDGDSLGVFVERKSRPVAMEESAKSFQKGIKHYGNTGFHADFEKHAAKRRNRGGKGS